MQVFPNVKAVSLDLLSMMNIWLHLLLSLMLLVFLARMTESAHILALLPLFAKSHHIILQSILQVLAQAGHQIISYSPYPLEKPHPNYTDVILETGHLSTEEVNAIVMTLMERPHWKCLDTVLPEYDEMIQSFFSSDKVQELLQSTEKFDLLITEAFTGQEFTLVFSHIFKIPVIVIQTFSSTLYPSMNLGNSLSMASIPDGCAPYSDRMSFTERLVNSFSLVRSTYKYKNEFIPIFESKLRKYVPSTPPLQDLINNVSLMFVNDHMTAEYAQPRTPNIIPIGGIHIADEKPLPQDIKEFMDDATEGVILLSLGTLVPDDIQSKEYFDVFKNVFRKLRQKVLWKTKKDNIGIIPDNVKVVKWMPQRDVLAHPKCVLFITHGGLASMHETIYNGVPVIGIPFFVDQLRNVALYQAKEIGVRILHTNITEDSLFTSIQTVLSNPRYKDNMKRLSQIYRDQPMSPAQTVLFWTEYVLRHRGAENLRPASTQLAWYQLALVDVIGAIIAVSISLAVVAYLIIKRLLLLIQWKVKSPTSTAKKIN